MSRADAFATHEVLNQSPPLGDTDLWAGDLALQDCVSVFGSPGNTEVDALAAFGKRWGSTEFFEWGRLANEYPPRLRTHDAKGFRADVVEFHPSYHSLMRESAAAGIHCSVWGADGKPVGPGASVLRAARLYMSAEVEQGHQCPIVMTHAATGALVAEPSLLAEWLPRVRSLDYDPSFRPAREKKGVTLGMGMTEKQGGSDVRANTTRAEPDGDAYRIVGHKWFFSAPMCDAFLVLAQARGGLTCFLLPRFRPDGTPNALRLVRLKEKLGNRSNASSEVEFEGAYARRCGPEGEGVKTIIGMVQLTRLDCVTGSLGIMRSALMQAIHHTRYRTAFQRKLVDQPLMRAVLADLALEREAGLALMLRIAAAFDRASTDEHEAAYARLVTPAAKLMVCKATPGFVYEALECVGGNGFVEEGPFARLYREAPLNAIWEGSGNIMALDVLRGAARDVQGAQQVLSTLHRAVADLPYGSDAIERVRTGLKDPERETLGRRTAEALAQLAAAAALKAAAPQEIAEVYAASRLGGIGLRNYGNPMAGRLVEVLLQRGLANGG
jgi:putative acyl-CoA dehydrogenase